MPIKDIINTVFLKQKYYYTLRPNICLVKRNLFKLNKNLKQTLAIFQQQLVNKGYNQFIKVKGKRQGI